MAGVDVTDAAFAGFGVLRRRPLAAVAWAALSAGFVGLVLVLFGGAVVSAIASLAGVYKGASQPGAAPDTSQISTLLSAMGSLFGAFAAFGIGALLLGAVIASAVFRAVLEPENSAYAYLRLGRTELWLVAQGFVQSLLLSLAQAVMAMPLAIITLVAFQGNVSSGPALAISGLGRLIVYGLTIWLYLRLSLAAPMTFADRKFRMFESWELTKGQDLRLLGVGLLVFAVAFAIYLGLLVVLAAGGFATVAGLFEGVQLKSQYRALSPAGWIALLTPLAGLGLGVFAVGAVVLIPITLAPWARVYQHLSPREDVATVFA